jgi:2-oxo-4-hydroxy-4-carboxy--5-ureidoimidazoline (OHCU) decarboxylase
VYIGNGEVQAMNENVVSFQSVIENGTIRLPEIYREKFTAPVLVTVRENKRDEILTADEITARLNEIYSDNTAVIDEDIQLAQYNLVSEEDW